MNNAIKHGHAKRITISLTVTDNRNVLKVEDNGCGIPDQLPEEDGMGLAVMRYRSSTIGGTFNVQGLRKHGMVVTCSVPINQTQAKIDNEHREPGETT